MQIVLSGSKSYDPAFSDTVMRIFNTSVLTVVGDSLSTVVTRLTPGTDYSLTVAAINGAVRNNGLGEASLPALAQTDTGEI